MSSIMHAFSGQDDLIEALSKSIAKQLQEAKRQGKINDYNYKRTNWLMRHFLINVLPWMLILGVVWYFLFYIPFFH